MELMEHWTNRAEDDYNAMIAVYDSKQYNWSLFIGHLVVEKLLKGLYAKLNEKEPYAPKTHNLLALAERCNLELNESQVDVLSRITRFNIMARYDDAKNDFHKRCTAEYAKGQIAVIKELKLWLKEKLI